MQSYVTPIRSARLIEAAPTLPRYVLTALIYLCVDFAINYVTNSHHFHNSSITLWSPDDGIDLLLLTESTLYTPIVFFAAIVVDLFISQANYNLYSVFASELALATGYLFMAIVLRDVFKFDTRSTSYKNVVAVLAVVPVSSLVTGIIYTTVLHLTGSLPANEIYNAARRFWIGDTVGMIVVLPAATAFHDAFVKRSWRNAMDWRGILTMIAIAICVAVFIYVSTAVPTDRYLFNMIFLPMIWLCINAGFTAVAIMLLYVQVLLVGVMTYYQIDDEGFIIFQTSVFILASTGQLLGAIITEREQTTRELRHQQSELARVSAQATTAAMAVAMAHEISQPLSSLSNYVHSARRMVDGGQSAESIRNALAKAEAEARRTREIIERIRDFVASGQLRLERTDLEQVARKIVMLNVDDAASRGVELTSEFPEGTPPALVDKIAIEQALNNLVTNAIDAAATRAGSSGHVMVRLYRGGAHVVFQVDDDGPGVAPEMTERLFQVFETTKAGGMGLGLPLTLQIARKHAGRLEWRVLRPQGSSFLMELPIDGPDDEAD